MYYGGYNIYSSKKHDKNNIKDKREDMEATLVSKALTLKPIKGIILFKSRQ